MSADTLDPADAPTFVVGIGASAGGLEALERFFEQVPPDTGMAFVVVQHLSPDFKSLTDDILARRTALPIHRVENGMAVRRDALYLIPPKKDMVISGGRLLLTDKERGPAVSLPIDHFFRSLAQELGRRAVGIVLSGTGSDGSRGIRDIHDAGGLVIVQSPETSKFDGMPRSAVETGTVDLQMSPEEIPDALLRHAHHPRARPAPVPALGEEPVGLAAIFRLLRDRCGIDFSQYRAETVTRRVERRLALGDFPTVEAYADRLAVDPAELDRMYKDLLIGVTKFFRDEEAFARLEAEVLPGLLERVARGDEFRVWVAGCATGEEAYSVAILAQECVERSGRSVPVKVFATDAHRQSLETAGVGVYPDAALDGVAAARRERWFARTAGGWHVVPDLRKAVVFAQHNVLKDAPFTKLDLVTCRNLLIYFQPPAQHKALTLFHFALKAGGVLFLGPSETAGDLADEFESLDARWKLFRKRRDVRLAADLRLSPSLPAPVGRPAASVGPDAHLVGTYDALLDEFMPAALLVNESREVVQAFGGGSRFLRLRDGRVSTDLLDMVDPALRTALAGAIPRAFKGGSPVAYRNLPPADGDPARAIDVTVRPVRNRRGDVAHVLVQLSEVARVQAAPATAAEIDAGQASRDHVHTLETELRQTKENLQAMIEELETSNEELQATNEELVAANEELQSTNEELHSVNEELHTVNAEYQRKIVELTELTTDMNNLLESTEIHTIFLDRALCIRKFTPPIAETFSLRPQDVGRPIDNFTYSIDHAGLLDDLRGVLGGGPTAERQVRDRRGHWYLLRVLPYRVGLAVDGVVLTLVQIDNLREAEAATRRKEEQLSGILRNSPNWIFIKDLDGRYVVADESFRRAVGREPLGRTAHDLFPRAVADQLVAGDAAVLRDGEVHHSEVTLHQIAGPRTYLVIKFPLRDDAGRIVGVGGIKTDVTPLKQAEQSAREAVEQRDRFLAMLSHELRNPLAAVLNAARMIDRLGPTGPGSADWVGVIERRARHMARLLDDLLDVVRLSRDTIEIRTRTFDLASTVGDVTEEVLPWFTERRLELIQRRPDGPLLVEGDPTRLQQIQVNLLLNAAKYTPPGGRVWHTLAAEGEWAVIRVKDTGVGMPPEMLQKVFELFVQLDDVADRSGGIGVGLTLVRAVVELHGGTVEAHSGGLGQGSEFVVRLPLAPGPVSSPPAPVTSSRRPAILVVEDDPDIRQSMEALLALDGYPVRSVPDGLAALAELDREVPAVVLVDIGLPGLNGYDLARRVRQRFGAERPRLVALTGYGRQTDRDAAFAAGFDAHLTKPFHPEELAVVLGGVTAPAESAD